MVRTLNEYENLEQIEHTVVARFEGRDVRIGQIGEVERAHKEREILTRTNGHESVQIDIFKEADANIVALAKRIKTELGDFDLEEAKRQADLSLEERKEIEAEQKGQERPAWLQKIVGRQPEKPRA